MATWACFIHELWEVHTYYGDQVKFYQRVSSDVATNRFVDYVRAHPDYGAIENLFEERYGKVFRILNNCGND